MLTRVQASKIRKIARIRKRELKHASYAAVNLNGRRALARRRRQMGLDSAPATV